MKSRTDEVYEGSKITIKNETYIKNKKQMNKGVSQMKNTYIIKYSDIDKNEGQLKEIITNKLINIIFNLENNKENTSQEV